MFTSLGQVPVLPRAKAEVVNKVNQVTRWGSHTCHCGGPQENTLGKDQIGGLLVGGVDVSRFQGVGAQDPGPKTQPCPM